MCGWCGWVSACLCVWGQGVNPSKWKFTHTYIQTYTQTHNYLFHPHVGALARGLEEEHPQKVIPVGVAPLAPRLRQEGYLVGWC